MSKNFIEPTRMVSIKGKGRISAECIVTARVTIIYHYDDDPDPSIIRTNVTATAPDLDMFITFCCRDENAEVHVEILDINQPLLRSHDDNLKWLDNLEQVETDDAFYDRLFDMGEDPGITGAGRHNPTDEEPNDDEGDPPDELGKP